MSKIAIFLLSLILVILFIFGYLFFINIDSLEKQKIESLKKEQEQRQKIKAERIRKAQEIEAEQSQQVIYPSYDTSYPSYNPTIESKSEETAPQTPPVETGRPFALFIVLDDAGSSLNEVQALEKFQGDLSIAIIPHLQHSKDIAEFLYRRNISYIIHLPMEPYGDADPGPYAVSTDSSDEDLQLMIEYNLSNFDNYLGFNNHMGSKAVSDPRVVDTLLSMLERKMIVLDSRTSSDSILEMKAKEYDMIGLNRDIFIDNYDDIRYIKEQIRKGVKIAKQKHAAILIGHITKENTIQAITEMYEEITKQNGKFLGLKDYHGFISSFSP